ncbi:MULTISPECIES: energy transducer TonB [Vitreoscilla]|uniref:Protein TonB n=1 Tax=Vitreoscilla stercoraria TaxID=61 RepID=A0ABY4E969_VITST|nr:MULTISPECIES: energy transducer TonB [Vitreoscilla]AUZ06410.1 TonB family protein [Vitreoscilla sp. C1]UOO92304.1 energy transducer TonB [Vitreoscilla stercoraria]
MKKNTQFALTIFAVSLLHAAGIAALSSFEDKPAELITTQEELTFVEIGSAPPPAAAPLVAPVTPVVKKPKPQPDIKRTIVKKPEVERVIERKPEPKPEKKIEPKIEKPQPEKIVAKPKPAEPTAPANTAPTQTASAGTHQAAGSQGSGKGTAIGKEGEGKGGGSGSGEGNSKGGGSGPTSGPKIAGSASCLSPVYPQESIDRGEAGSVKVRWTVGADGSVLNVEVTGSSGHARLDNAALRQAKKCRFSPALKGGVPVQNNYTRPYNFKIS